MNGLCRVVPIVPVLLAGAAIAQSDAWREFSPTDYPETFRGSTVDIYHGTAVPDPYRWLENAESPETEAWVERQNELSRAFIESVPERQGIIDRLTTLWNYERFGIPNKEGGLYFYSRNDGLQAQSVLYVAESLDAEPRVLIDPNTLSEDGTVALGGTSVSPDGTYIAYSVADGGSDWRIWRVRNIATGEDLTHEVRWSKFSGAAWAGDESGFYYTRYPEPPEGEFLTAKNENPAVYFHAIGTPQEEDRLVYSRPDQPNWSLGAGTSDDGRHLFIYMSAGTDDRNGIAHANLETRGDGEIRVLKNPLEAEYGVVATSGDTAWLVTTEDAPLRRLVSTNLAELNPTWTEVLPEVENKLAGVDLVGDKIIAEYLENAKASVKLFTLQGRAAGEVNLPGVGSAFGFSGDLGDPETFFSFSSYNRPSTVYRYDVSTGQATVFRAPELAFNPDDYVTEQVFYSSKDGTRVPMFISHKKGLELNGENPTLLYGYGGFNISLTPGFSPANLAWMEMGGIYVVANLRGGGEYGSEWHDAGRLHNKQNVFDDFIAAAEHLIQYRYTRPERLGIFGGSNGGLLVGACLQQRPELFGAAIPAVGVMDMLRFDRFTIGYAWRSDYGWPEKHKADFDTNIAFSPYHNAKSGVCYPPTLVTTADRDDRVVPAHSYKFTAAMQHVQRCDNPILIRVDTRAGHGAGTPTSKRIEQAADRWSFLVRTLGVGQ
ncbi:MAG: prolyl oligopeptidase family serine peptidase [Planctomycetota bacterium]